ncbi:MAG: NAD-dependent epimerase/dehydratase family protein [Actinomycetota bacterium]
MGKRVLITGASSFLGVRLAEALAGHPSVSEVIGVDVRPPKLKHDRFEFIRADIRSPLIYRVLTTAEPDTVVHADITSRPGRAGGRSAQKEQNVIGTMQLLGACQRAEFVRKVVVRSSTAVYGNGSTDPSILREDWSSRALNLPGYSKDVFEAEQFARDFGRRRPDVSLTILRMANIVGPTAETSMTQFFSLALVPTALGFDPRLQLLHEDDAIEILRRSVTQERPGVFNAAADGVIYLSQAIRIARRLPLPLIPALATITGDLLRRAGVVDFPTDQISLIVHGRVVDNTRLKKLFGYVPRYTTGQAFRDFVAARGDNVSGPRALVDWEKELYGLLSSSKSLRAIR